MYMYRICTACDFCVRCRCVCPAAWTRRRWRCMRQALWRRRVECNASRWKQQSRHRCVGTTAASDAFELARRSAATRPVRRIDTAGAKARCRRGAAAVCAHVLRTRAHSCASSPQRCNLLLCRRRNCVGCVSRKHARSRAVSAAPCNRQLCRNRVHAPGRAGALSARPAASTSAGRRRRS